MPLYSLQADSRLPELYELVDQVDHGLAQSIQLPDNTFDLLLTGGIEEVVEFRAM